MWSTSMPSRPAAASRAIDASGTTSPRLTASGCAKTVTPPAALTSRIASKGSSSCFSAYARPPLASHSGVKASETVSTTPSSTSAVAMCGRPTEPSPAIRATCSQVDGNAELLELAHHRLRARHPVVADQLALARQLGLVGVEEVREHVQADAVDPAGELGAGDQGEALGERGDRLGVAADGVVVGERDDVEPCRGGVPHQLGGGVRAVRRGGVGVQVDAHDAYSRARSRTGGRSRITGVRTPPGQDGRTRAAPVGRDRVPRSGQLSSRG